VVVVVVVVETGQVHFEGVLYNIHLPRHMYRAYANCRRIDINYVLTNWTNDTTRTHASVYDPRILGDHTLALLHPIRR